MTAPLRKGPHGPVPYIAKWSAERPASPTVIETAQGIGYATESAADRDRNDVLWARTTFAPGEGEPDYRAMHSMRQRRAMRRLLCQVCAQPADQDERGTLWLLPDYRHDWPGWPAGVANTQPPLCLRCARMSVRLCPALQRPALIRAHSTVVGVSGALYAAGPSGPVPVSVATVQFTDPAIRRVRASHLVRELHDCTLLESL
jgi:hypothetical protein